MEPRQYKVLFTPLIDRNEYGTEIDVTSDIDYSDFIRENGIGTIKQRIENDDYDIGVFVYDKITLKAVNIDGMFNDESDWRSIFIHSRDKSKVKITFLDGDGETTISFKGMINEEGTRQDIRKNEVKFKVLSQDSVIRKTNVTAGNISTGMLFSQAIKNIINVPDITSVLNYDAAEIIVDVDLTIDDGSWFDNKTAKEALDALMIVSNSVMIIDDTDTMIVRTRAENTGQVFPFFGPADMQGRQNILDIRAFNTGLHRMFNSILVNDTEFRNDSMIELYGIRQKPYEFGFMSDAIKVEQIALKILDEFKTPKPELKLIADTKTAKQIQLFDLISINYPYETSPAKNTEVLPLYGVSKYGEARYPVIKGDIKITERFAFKVMGFKENPKNFTTEIHIRQRGRTLSDMLFSSFLSLYGSAIYGENVYQEDINRIDPNVNSVYGAATYGVTKYGAGN